MPDPVTFELPDPAYAEYTWILWDEHGPSSVPPLLDRSSRRPQWSAEVPGSLRINGFRYVRAGARDDGGDVGFGWGPPAPTRNLEDMTRWRDEWLPQVEELERDFRDFDPASVPNGDWVRTLEAQSRLYSHIFGGIHRTAIFPARVAMLRFIEAYVDAFGEERRPDAEALIQGMPNRTIDRTASLWSLSRRLRQSPEVAAALESGRSLPATPEGDAFRQALDAVLAEFGHTTNADLEDLPTWAEDPAVPLATVRAYAQQPDERDPLETFHRHRDRRIDLEGELRSLAATDAAAAALLPMMAMAQQYVPNLEDHNMESDQRMTAASRARWLAVGRHLAAENIVDSAADVFFLYRDELIAALEGAPAVPVEVLRERRALLNTARAMRPPPVLGRPVTDAEESQLAGTETSEVRVIRGTPASAGIYRGRARLIETLEEAAAKLEEGDVMVCRTTSPPWTPFFALIGAIVTNSGGALAHGAVVAREFGIPAVMGTLIATAQVPDGAMVTVDGTQGIVIIES